MYQGEVVILILHQILGTNLQGNVLQLERRINNRILGVKGLIDSPYKNMSIIMVKCTSKTITGFVQVMLNPEGMKFHDLPDLKSCGI